MSAYTMDLFGKYESLEIQSIVDRFGNFWFTEQSIAEALGEERHHVLYIRTTHDKEFKEDEHYTTISFEGKRRIVYSEEGFLTICDISKSKKAYDLRKWARKQFRVKQRGSNVVVTPKTDREDLSDLPQEIVLLYQMIDNLAEDKRRIKKLEREQAENAVEIDTLTSRANDTEVRIAQLEGRDKIAPGELTATLLAQKIRWVSRSGGDNNPAVVLAAINENFYARKLMHTRNELEVFNRLVEVHIFSPDGIRAFCTEIDSKYSTGDYFIIEPNEIARSFGYKNKRHVWKR